MLVCSAVLRPRRTVAAVVAEAGAALDNVVRLGIGQLVNETANASDVVGVSHVSLAAIIETAAAADAPSATVELAAVVAGSVAETTTAADTPDAATVSGAVARNAMLPELFVNSAGTARQANVGETFVNL